MEEQKKTRSQIELINDYVDLDGEEFEELKNQVMAEYQTWFNYVTNKRELFRRRLELYHNITDTENKIYVRLLFAVIETLMALYYQDDITVHFAWRQLEDDEIANNIDNLAKFDQEEMWLDVLNYKTQWDRFFYWVSIRALTGWDKIRKVPTREVIDPLCWIADPDWYINDHKYHWFERECTERDLKEEDWYFNLDLIVKGTTNEKDLNRQWYLADRLLNTPDTNNSEVYSLYFHYTNFDWEKYLTVWANNRSLIIKIFKLEAVTEAEKKEPSNIPFPVVLNYYRPVRYDVFGICVPDLLEDKQQAIQLLLNLNRIKSEHEAWGDIFMYDPDAVKNINDLKIPTLWPKYVKADLKINPNPIMAVNRGQIKQDNYNMPWIIQNDAYLAVWVDAQWLWISWEQNITATENQRVQKNANIKLILWNRINQWGEKMFWSLWYRAYKQYFNWSDKKNIRLNNGLWNIVYTIKKTDIISNTDVDIKIINQSEEEWIKEKEKIGFMAVVNMLLADPSIPAISKRLAMRKMLTLNWLSKEESVEKVPESPEEMQAKLDVELLNKDEDPYLDPTTAMWEDQMTYIIVYKRALNTDAKQRALFKRMQLYIKSWQSQQMNMQNQGQQWIANQTSNQITGAALQQLRPQEQWAASLQDINMQ